MAKHALLSASSSHRWLECPPSAKLCAAHPDRASLYAQQGTDAHELAAYKVQRALGMKARDPTEDLEYFDQEMADCTDAYCAFVMERLAEARKHCADPIVLVEQRLDFSKWVPEGFGTGDACIVADDVLHVIDLKYGVGIMVDATQNPQTMCYALGLLEAFDGIYDVSTVRMTIFQPRRENISTFEMSKADLLTWAENVWLLQQSWHSTVRVSSKPETTASSAPRRQPAGSGRSTTWKWPGMTSRFPPSSLTTRSPPSCPGSMN